MDIIKFNRITRILIDNSDQHSMNMVAEHDEIYLGGPTNDEVSEEDIKELERLGCAWNEENYSWLVFT